MGTGAYVCCSVILAMILAEYVECATQEDIDYFGNFLEIKIKTVDNTINGMKDYEGRITLRNTGNEVIRKGDWAIYMCFVKHIYRPEEKGQEKFDYVSYGVNFTHVKGCNHRMEPLDTFPDLSPGEQMFITFLGANWQVARTDYPPNWYVVSTTGNVTPRTLISTSGESLDFVENFTKPEQWKRFYFTDTDGNVVSDKYDPFSPRVRYVINDINDLGKAVNLLIPTPVFAESNEKKKIFFGTHDWVIVVQDDPLRSAAQYLSDLTMMPVVNASPEFRYIRLFLGNPVVTMLNGKKSNSSEAYELRTDSAGQWASITAATAQGAFYGVQSLILLWDEDKEAPEVTILDAPRYSYRGMHLDVGRNFHSKDYVLKLLNIMGMYKLNKFHFHLTDDEGWRLQIPGLDELTQVGGKRCFDLDEESCVISQYGSGPTTQSSGSGFYTVDEYKEILAYAAARHIEVIPEFDMPGHGHAAIVAMKKRYNQLKSEGNEAGAKEFLLTDPNDTSVYESIQMFDDNAINPCMESTYNFITHLVREVKKMHDGINPLKIYHFGGDEVAKGAWENSTACDDLKDKNRDIRDTKDLKEYMVRRIANITAEVGLDMAAWEDGLMGGDNEPFNMNELANDNVYGYAWDNVWEWGASNRPVKLANADYKVVMSQATHLYFDHPHEPDPEERGYYWAPRYTDSRKTFGFLSENIFANADFTRGGDPLSEETLCAEVDGTSQCIPLEKPENVVGIQGHLWSETVRTPEQADSMIFPRFFSLVERAWHKAEWEDENDVPKREMKKQADWENFANTLGYRELKRLDSMNIKYHIPQPGAHIVGRQIQFNSAFPGLKVEFSSTEGDTWCSDIGIITSAEILLRTRSADGGRVSRVERIVVPLTAGKSSTRHSVLVVVVLTVSALMFSLNR